MQHGDYVAEKHRREDVATTLTSVEVTTIADLIAELREITLSRASYRAASEMLKRFGRDVDASALVSPDSAGY